MQCHNFQNTCIQPILNLYIQDNLIFFALSVSVDVQHLSQELESDKNNTVEKCRNVIVNTIRDMVEEKCKEYDEIRYISRESLTSQIRFIYHTSNGRSDDTDILGKNENYNKLINIHAILSVYRIKTFHTCCIIQPKVYI